VFDRPDSDDHKFLPELLINKYAETCWIVEIRVIGQDQVLVFNMDCDAPECETNYQEQDASLNGNWQLFC
jgi:hypothetical protein